MSISPDASAAIGATCLLFAGLLSALLRLRRGNGASWQSQLNRTLEAAARSDDPADRHAAASLAAMGLQSPPEVEVAEEARARKQLLVSSVLGVLAGPLLLVALALPAEMSHWGEIPIALAKLLLLLQALQVLLGMSGLFTKSRAYAAVPALFFTGLSFTWRLLFK